MPAPLGLQITLCGYLQEDGEGPQSPQDITMNAELFNRFGRDAWLVQAVVAARYSWTVLVDGQLPRVMTARTALLETKRIRNEVSLRPNHVHSPA